MHDTSEASPQTDNACSVPAQGPTGGPKSGNGKHTRSTDREVVIGLEGKQAGTHILQ